MYIKYIDLWSSLGFCILLRKDERQKPKSTSVGRSKDCRDN